MATDYLTHDGDLLDAICWLHYGRQSGAVEAVLDANSGLADRGPVYPTGVLLTLPDLSTPAVAATLRLWN